MKNRPRAPSRDAGPRDRDGQIRLARAGAADQNDVALVRQELAASQVAHQGLVDRRAVKGEIVDILGQRQLGDGDLVADGPRLLLADLGRPCNKVSPPTDFGDV